MTRSSNPRMPLALAAATALVLGLGGHATAQQPVVHHKTVKVGELDIFYREAGPKDTRIRARHRPLDLPIDALFPGALAGGASLFFNVP
jgi:hypothetical protein